MCAQGQYLASDYIRALVCGYARDIRLSRSMAMLQGYVDDSGSHQRSAVYVLAGFIATTEQWADFSDEWSSCLIEAPSVDYLKMHEASGLKGQFICWDMHEAVGKVRRIVDVLEKHKPIGICSALSWEEFNRNMLPHVENLAGDGSKKYRPLKDPYQYLFPVIWEVIAKYQRQQGTFPEPIDVDFDEQGSAAKFAQAMYPEFKKSLPPDMQQMMGRIPIMLDDKRYVALQAADMLAWSIRRKLQYPAPDDNWDWLHERLLSMLFGGLAYRPASYKVLLDSTKDLRSHLAEED